ncbi:MAG TPA: hypothetical protein VIS94_03215 [Desulfomonilia bacterium]
MKRGGLIVIGLVWLVLAFGLSGCKIISASPNPNQVIEMKPGDKVLFKVDGPVNTPTSKCVWSISNHSTLNEEVSRGKNEYELSFDTDTWMSNKSNTVTCEYQTYQPEFYCDDVTCFNIIWTWKTVDSRTWEVKTNPNSSTVISGDYYIYYISDLKSLRGYTTVTGSLIIAAYIENLQDLDKLTTIGGDLKIVNNELLKSLAGLENVSSIGRDLKIVGNTALTSLSALENMTSIGGSISISGNDALINLSGLENLTSVNRNLIIGELYYGGNPVLTSLDGLENITSVGGYLSIWCNESLTSLDGLENITSIVGTLDIRHNDALTSLYGLDNLISVGGRLIIWVNDALTNLSALDNLKSVGDDLSISGNDSLTVLGIAGLERVGGDYEITDNPMLCTLLAEELMNQVLAGGGIGGVITISGNKICTTP